LGEAWCRFGNFIGNWQIYFPSLNPTHVFSVSRLLYQVDYESEGQGFESLRVYHSQDPATHKVAGFFVFAMAGDGSGTTRIEVRVYTKADWGDP
jgi:hypothetical protein